MKKGLLVFLIILAVVAIVFVLVMTHFKWDFTKLSTVEYETNRYAITDDFKNISVLTDIADVSFVIGNTASVECNEIVNMKHRVYVEADTLTIRVEDTRKWYEHIGIFFGTPKITVQLPADQYEKLTVKTDTGDATLCGDFTFAEMDIKSDTGAIHTQCSATGSIKLKTDTGRIFAGNLTAARLEMISSTGRQEAVNVAVTEDVKNKVSTGKTTFENITCKSLISDGDTGSLTLNNVIATEKFALERSTGNVTLNQSDAKELYIETDTGNVKGSLLSDKIFLTETDTGKIDVPKTVTGGRCEISTDTGNIVISIAGK